MALLFLTVLIAPALAAKRRAALDTTSAVAPAQWYCATNHWEEIMHFVNNWHGAMDLHGVDCFSASKKMTNCFQRRGFRCQPYDIQLSMEDDAASESGWWKMLILFLRVLLGHKKSAF